VGNVADGLHHEPRDVAHAVEQPRRSGGHLG
jgi:hypothetical protein